MPRVYVRTPVIDRLMAKVVEKGDCWVWTGAVGSSGYGQIGLGGRVSKSVSTHRYSYEFHRGEIPAGLVLDHLCGVILCCNPWHLDPVTQAENIRRRAARRTTCSAGHTYTPESTYTGRNGRECRICHAEREAARRVRKRRPDYAEVCSKGHRRTPDNTFPQGTGLRCGDCTSEAATARHARARGLR